MPLNIDWQQILLHLFNFLILFAGLWVLLYKPVRDFMRKRRSEYEQQDAEAQKKQQDAEALHAQYEQQLADVDRDAEEKRAALQKEMDGYAELRRKSAQAEADTILQKAREQAAREKEKSVRDARREIAAIASEAAEKLALHETPSEAYDAFLDAAEAQDTPAQNTQKDEGDRA